MNKKNYYLIGFALFLFFLLMLSVNTETEIENTKLHVNETTQNDMINEVPEDVNEPEEIVLEIPHPKPSWYGSMNNITIDETGWIPGSYKWEQAKDEPWCTKISDNNYIIENVTIDASSSPTGCGILINNSKNVYFTIRNCSITSAVKAGIYLFETCNGTMINNTVIGNGGYGIYMGSYCQNNTIANNTANGNSKDGIRLETNCHYNNLTGNIAISNNWAGIRLQSNSDFNLVAKNHCNYSVQVDGIQIEAGSDNNTLINNTVCYNHRDGIRLYDGCLNNTIDNNIANGNNQRGISIFTNSYNNTIINNNLNDNYYEGIYLENNCDDNKIIHNNASNTAVGYDPNNGIILKTGCDNNLIENNNFNDNDERGIYILTNCHNNTIINNNLYNNGWEGIYIYDNCDDNKIIHNNASNTAVGYDQSNGIILTNGCDNNLIENNTCNDNGHRGIFLYTNCNNNFIINNTCNGNSENYPTPPPYGGGIDIRNGCHNNTIYHNTANNNFHCGIKVTENSHDNNITENVCNGNGWSGIRLYAGSENNRIINNTANGNEIGIELGNYCDNNTISDNILYDNDGRGIYLFNYCDDNKILRNNATYNKRGLLLEDHCDDNLIIGNNFSWNSDDGIFIYQIYCTDNTINDNYICNNGDDGIVLYNHAERTIITNNIINDNGGNGISIASASHNSIVHNNTVNDNDGNGIGFSDSTYNCRISHNIFNDNTNYAWYLTGSCTGNVFIGNTLNNNDIESLVAILNAMNCIDGVCTPLIIDADGSTADSFTWEEVLMYVPWFSGAGTLNDPYVIEDITVNATGSDQGLYIIDSKNSYFTIENCLITGAYHSGIYLFETCNGTIINNNCSYNNFAGAGGAGHGIGLWSNSHSNKIINNTCNWNYRGIHTGYSNDLIIANNTLKNNNYEGIMLSTLTQYSNVTGNIISSNVASPTMDEGILSYNSHNNNIINNTIENCQSRGMRFSISTGNTIENNVINNILGIGQGIYLFDRSDSNRVYSNTITNCDVAGIEISTDCDGNNFTRNVISNNGDYGVNILQATCENNLFYNNSFIGNPDNALDEGSYTKWNNTQIGNYWDDYGGVDANDNGIGDTWYEVSNGRNDKRPIWWDAPVISIISPEYLDLFGNATINFTLSITKTIPSLCNMWYMLINVTNSADKTGNQTFTQYPSHYILFNLWNTFENGYINIWFFVNDSRGYIGSKNITVEKNLNIPTISIVNIGFHGVGGASAINFTVSLDGPGVDKFWYRILNGSQWTNNFSFSAVIGLFNKKIDTTLWTSLLNGTYTIQFFLNDTVAMGITTKINGTFIKDIVAPMVIITSPSNNDLAGISPPDIKFNIYEGNLHQIWYELNETYGNYTYRDDLENELDKILDEYWSILDNGTITIKFWANDTGGNINFTIFTLTLRKDIINPIITIDPQVPDPGRVYTSTAPIYRIETIVEPHTACIYYTLFDGVKTLTSLDITKWYDSINQTLWDSLDNGLITITFYVVDEVDNIGYTEVLVEKQAPIPVVPPSNGGDGGDGDDDEEPEDIFPWYGILPWYFQAMITGAISAMVGVAIKMSYNRFRKQRDMRAMMEAPTVILKKKYEIVHHDFLIEYGKIEKHECRIGIAQIGLSYTSGEDFANEYFTSDESHMMRLRPNMVEKVRANIKKMVGQAHENGVNILLFPEMTFDLNLNKMKKDVLKYAEDYNMYIITGGYHDVKTRQNVCVVFGPDGIQWSQEKHNPATIKLGENIIQEGIEIAPIPHKLHVASTEYGRIAIAICRDFLDMDLRVALKNCEPPVDLVFNPAWTPVTADFEAIHFDARRSIYAYQFFANVAEFGGTIIQVPEKDRTKRTIPAKEEGLIFKDVDIFSLRSERIKWEQKQAKERGFIQSTR